MHAVKKDAAWVLHELLKESTETHMNNPRGTPNSFISWVHLGDLHIRKSQDENYLDFLELITDVNEHLAGDLDFAFLPGDNADDGTAQQYQFVKQALSKLMLPQQIIAGDHDRKSGTLDLFQSYLEPDPKKDFDFSLQQVAWLEAQLKQARAAGFRTLVFTHLYPSELLSQGKVFSRLLRDFQVELVEMGHTHYNEIANDGTTIYATTRSTGQIQEGPPGFSITAIDGDVISWKFHERGPWPFVMITSPSDEKLITKPESSAHLVRGLVSIKARVLGKSSLKWVTCSISDDTPQPISFSGGFWEMNWDSRTVPDGRQSIVLSAETTQGERAYDEISILVNQAAQYQLPPRREIEYENSIGPYEGKGILGTELGPNEKGTKGPWPSWRGK